MPFDFTYRVEFPGPPPPDEAPVQEFYWWAGAGDNGESDIQLEVYS